MSSRWDFLGLTFALFFGMFSASLRADQVINDDLIVDGGSSGSSNGSLGVGFDIEDGHPFDFDTIVLKESNIGIGFDDTDSGPGDPNNDWRIQINDTSNAGSDHFAVIDDTAGTRPFLVEAGAPTDTFQLGPNGDLSILAPSSGERLTLGSDAAPGIRLEQSGGVPPARNWSFLGSNSLFLIRDDSASGLFSFRIAAGQTANAVLLKSDGTVGIGTTDPNAKVHLAVDTSSGEGLIVGAAAVATNTATLHVAGTAFVSETLEIGSSRDRKEAIRPLLGEDAVSALAELRPRRYRYRDDPPDTQRLGFIAEEVPELLACEGRASLSLMDFVAVLTEVVQDHCRREDELRETIHKQQRALDEIAQRIDALEGNPSPPSP
ncbi:MAG: tail fiber domain-containing protein [Verrucomicrobiota bacterium]